MGTDERVEIGQRVRKAMTSHFGSSLTQRAIAESLEIAPDAFSRSLNGERAFSSGELARAAHLFDADLYWLITGEADPLRMVYAARHTFDRAAFAYRNDNADGDRQIRDGVALSYRQAHQWLTTAAAPIPNNAPAVRALLGGDFSRHFADRVEERLGIDVAKLPDLATAYSICVADQRIILINVSESWFRSNWSLAHELAHFCLGHHDEIASRDDAHELQANAFAAELLMPESVMRDILWDAIAPPDVAQFVWDWGVSTEALRHRLNGLGLTPSQDVAYWLTQSTQRFLNNHQFDDRQNRTVDPDAPFLSIVDPIGERMRAAAERRVPARLIKAVRDGVDQGVIGAGTLYWLLGVDPVVAEQEEPVEATDTPVDDLIAVLGL